MKQSDMRQKILENALELFSVRGYDSVTMGDIAKSVGIKAPSLYNHFAGKQAIFDAIVESTAARYEADTGEIGIHVQNAALDYSEFAEIDEDALHNEQISRFRRMMTIEQFRSPELAALYSARYVERIVAYHADIFRSLMTAGEICREDPETLAMMYAAPVITLIGMCDRQPEREGECLEMLRRHVTLFFRTVNSGRLWKDGAV